MHRSAKKVKGREDQGRAEDEEKESARREGVKELVGPEVKEKAPHDAPEDVDDATDYGDAHVLEEGRCWVIIGKAFKQGCRYD